MPHVASVRCSRVVESEPWGFESEHRFLNMGVELSVDCSPEELFKGLMHVQDRICGASHRSASGGYADRLIDVDLIYFDDVIMSTPRLTLPHPRMHLRDFVLRPVEELAPGWHHPQTGLTAAEMLLSI